MKFLASSLFLSFALSNFMDLNSAQKPVENEKTQQSDTVAIDSFSYFSITATGDLMCHSTQFKYVAQEGGTFNFDPCFEYIAPLLKQADVCMGNLETTLAGKRLPYSGYPQFNTPDAYAVALKKAGFDVLITANNHSNDTGEKGIQRTYRVLDSLNLNPIGTFLSEEDRDSIRLFTTNQFTYSILSYTYSTNGLELPTGKDWLVNGLDSNLIYRDVAAARESGAELVFVYVHFGNEYERQPNVNQKKWASVIARAGADVILGSHPHVIQPAGRFVTANATVDTGFIAWSMGNFISNQRDPHTDEGVLLHLTFQKNLFTGKIRISHVAYTPTWVYKGTDDRMKRHVVFPARDTLPDILGPAYWKEMDESILHTAEQMNLLNGIIFDID